MNRMPHTNKKGQINNTKNKRKDKQYKEQKKVFKENEKNPYLLPTVPCLKGITINCSS